MRISAALLPLLAGTHTCLAFLAPPSPAALRTPNLVPAKRGSGIVTLSVAAASTDVGVPGTADLPWSELGFEFRPTKSHLKMVYRDGKWGEAELVEVG